MSELSISLFGSFQAFIDKKPLINFRTKAVQALFIYLASQPGSHPRETLMTLLWPDLPLKSAQSNLRHALYHLKKVVPEVESPAGEPVPFVLSNRQTLQVNPNGRFQLDITQFKTLCQSNKSDDWESTVSLYRGDFLNDFFLPNSPGFETWAQTRRSDFRRLFLDTLLRLTDHHIANGNFERAEQYARQQLAVDNLSEESHRQLMEVLAKSGRRTEAINHYQFLRELLEDELDITPSTETESLVESIRHEKFKETTSIEVQPFQGDIPNNLPVQTTPFIGRKPELAALDHLLADPNTKLVNILGAGGMGKTRLSLAAAEHQLTQERFTQGVFFVPLAGLSESERLVSAIANAVQLRLDLGESQLINYFRAKEILLVLDNFEHLLESSDLVSRILQAAPKVQILVTSRERLKLQGEQIYPIQGLSMDNTAIIDDARELFLQAARRLRPDFEATADNQPILNQICRLVEGLPLALELAAAWVDLLTLEEIAAEIERNLEFLTTDLRDVPSRHSSMQAVFAASWQRLTPGAQHLLAQLTIFKGGFSREAVMAVTNATLSDLAVLANNSLLVFYAPEHRYRMHKLLQQFAAAQFEVDTKTKDRYTQYYCRWVSNQEDRLLGLEQMTAAREINTDIDNIHAAVRYALQLERFPELDSALASLAEYYYVRGQPQEGIRLWDHIYKVLKSQPALAPYTLFWVSIRLSISYGIISERYLSGTYQELAKKMLATSFFKERDSQKEKAMVLHQEGYRLFQGDPEAALESFRLSQTLYENSSDTLWSSRNLIGMARAALNLVDFDLARISLRQSLSLAQSLDNSMLQFEAKLILGNLFNNAGHYDKAEKWLVEVIAQLRKIDQPSMLALGLTYLFISQRYNGRFKDALQTDQELQQVGQILGNPFHETRFFEAVVMMHMGEYGQSIELGLEALHAAQAKKENQLVYECWRMLGQLALVERNVAGARDYYQASENITTRFGMRLLSNQVFSSLLAFYEGKTAVSQRLILQAIREAVENHLERKLATSFSVVACLQADLGNPEQAIELYELAQQHPYVANSVWYADVIGNRINTSSANLPPEVMSAARERGKEMDIWQTAESLLKTLQF